MTPRKVLKDGALYWADNGHVICAKCAGQTALYTGRDLSGQKVERITVDDVHGWHQTLGESAPIRCDGSYRKVNACTLTLSCLAGPDGWPVARGMVAIS